LAKSADTTTLNQLHHSKRLTKRKGQEIALTQISPVGDKTVCKMTKDWDAVQEVIKDLSWNQRKPLEEVKLTMEQQHNFSAS
jgi:hypothetical protein